MSAARSLEPGQLCMKIAFIHADGTRVYPVAIRNRATGRVAFNLARPGTNSHHREAAIEIVDEAEVVRQVLLNGMKARCQGLNGEHKGQFSPSGRNIVRVEQLA